MIAVVVQVLAGLAGAVMVAAGVASFAVGSSVFVPMAGFVLLIAGTASMVWAVGLR